MPGCPKPVATVRHALVDGLVVILDLAGAEYFVLDDVGSAMWQAVAEADDIGAVGLEVAARRVARRYGIEEAVARDDLDQFVALCIERGFLETTTSPAVNSGGANTSLLSRSGSLCVRAWWSLFSTARRLDTAGFASTYARYGRLLVGTPRHDIEMVRRAFALAENLFVSRRGTDDCLPRSLSLFAYLRACGYPAHHVIGVRRVPFTAHAWVELDGEAVLDTADRSAMTSLARLEPI